MKDKDQIGSKKVLQVGKYLDISKQCPGLGFFTSQT